MTDVSTLLQLSPNDKTTPDVFWALDSRLPGISAEAAVEFDWLLQGKSANDIPSLKAINTLSSLLDESIELPSSDDETKSPGHTFEMSLFSRAYNEVKPDRKVLTKRDLPVAIEAIRKSLRDVSQGKQLDQVLLRDMRSFCVALSEYALVYRGMIYGDRREHPYRKFS